MRLVQEGIASPEQIDRICRMAGGFRMGPFALSDLVGVDVGFTIQKSFFEQGFAEPRWRPSPLAGRLAAAGHHGRKTGQGWFSYPPGPPEDPVAPAAGGGSGLVVIAGETALAAALDEASTAAGWESVSPDEADGRVPFLIVDCGATEDEGPLQGGPQVVLCDAGPLAALDPEGSAAGFFLLPTLGSLVELTRSPTTSEAAVTAAERFFSSLGMLPEWVGDAPGLVLGRIVCQLVNEACFALGEGVGSPQDIDTGMVRGLNHPRGPLEWGDAIGPGSVLAVIAGLQEEYREERYRPAPALRQLVAAGRLGRTTGAGFFDYDGDR
jgi:3-hydroxybutyryl-CoA dehydrogenase